MLNLKVTWAEVNLFPGMSFRSRDAGCRKPASQSTWLSSVCKPLVSSKGEPEREMYVPGDL